MTISTGAGHWFVGRSHPQSLLCLQIRPYLRIALQNQSLSGSYDTVLKAQGVNWLTRKVMATSAITMSIEQSKDNEGVTHLSIHSKPNSGLPGSTETRVLNNEPRELKHPIFGMIRGRTKWVSKADLPSDWLRENLEGQSSEGFILMTTEHLDTNATTYQANGFEVINGDNRYVRHVQVNGASEADEQARVKLVYDYLGPIKA